jgi:hypothetical protein
MHAQDAPKVSRILPPLIGVAGGRAGWLAGWLARWGLLAGLVDDLCFHHQATCYKS